MFIHTFFLQQASKCPILHINSRYVGTEYIGTEYNESHEIPQLRLIHKNNINIAFHTNNNLI